MNSLMLVYCFRLHVVKPVIGHAVPAYILQDSAA